VFTKHIFALCTWVMKGVPVHPLCLLVRARAQGLDYLQHETAAARRALAHCKAAGTTARHSRRWRQRIQAVGLDESTARWTARGKSSKFTSQGGGGAVVLEETKHGVPHACALQLAVKREGAARAAVRGGLRVWPALSALSGAPQVAAGMGLQSYILACACVRADRR
jgi:hypothetical protein